MNSFCIECIGKGIIKDRVQEIKECDDKCCPFYPERYANLPYQESRKTTDVR